MKEENKYKNFLIITVLNLWWIAIWGIAYIAIDFLAGKNKKLEFLIYVFLMLFVILFIVYNPDYIPHITSSS
jgi:hypothetical protein